MRDESYRMTGGRYGAAAGTRGAGSKARKEGARRCLALLLRRPVRGEPGKRRESGQRLRAPLPVVQ